MMAATARDTARMVVDEELTHAYVFPVSLSCVIYLARILQCVKTCCPPRRTLSKHPSRHPGQRVVRRTATPPDVRALGA